MKAIGPFLPHMALSRIPVIVSARIRDRGGERYNLKAFGTLTRAYTRAAADGGGVVYAPPGSYSISELDVSANKVMIAGGGPGLTELAHVSGNATLSLANCTDCGVQDLTITGATTGSTAPALYIVNATRPVVRNVRLTGGMFSTFLIQTSSDGMVDRVRAEGGKLVGGLGVGFWLFDNVSGFKFTNLDIYNMEGSGLGLDASSDLPSHGAVRENQFTNVRIRQVNTVSGSAALMLQAAPRNQFANFYIYDARAAGVVIQVDQDTANVGSSDENLLVNVFLHKIGTTAFYIGGGNDNRAQNIRIKDFNDANLGNVYPIVIAGVNTGGVDYGAARNTLDGFDIRQTNGKTYTATLRIDGTVPSVTGTRAVAIRQGAAVTDMSTTGTQSDNSIAVI